MSNDLLIVSLARASQLAREDGSSFSRERATIPAVNSDTNKNIIPLLMLARLPYRRLAENHVHKYPSDKKPWIIASLEIELRVWPVIMRLVMYHYVVLLALYTHNLIISIAKLYPEIFRNKTEEKRDYYDILFTLLNKMTRMTVASLFSLWVRRALKFSCRARVDWPVDSSASRFRHNTSRSNECNREEINALSLHRTRVSIKLNFCERSREYVRSGTPIYCIPIHLFFFSQMHCYENRELQIIIIK